MTINEAAAAWQLSRARIRKLIEKQRIPVQIYQIPGTTQKFYVIPDGTPRPTPYVKTR